MKLRQILLTVFSLGLALLLGGCKMVVLQPKGIIAQQEKDLLIQAVLLMLIVVVPVILLTFIISRHYRASNTKAKYNPNWSHSFLLEAIWWFIPCVIIVVLATMTWIYTHRLDPYKPLKSDVKPVTIQVVALRWRWLFIYPEQHIATINYIQFPVNTPVNFLITADAPMNSFQIPQLGGQIYAMNGMQTKLHLMANEVGVYNGNSVSFSGEGFSNMKFLARASSEKAFTQWVHQVQNSPNQTLTMTVYNQLSQPSEDAGTRYFSNVSPQLYDHVIEKFMRPDMNRVDTSEIGVHL